MKKLKTIFISGQLLFLLLFNYYTLHTKRSANQTGLDMKSDAAMFLVFGIVAFAVSKIKVKPEGKTDKLTLIIISIFILTSINFFLFDYFNILVEYNTWLGRGQPAKPFWF